jgi:hypothetical protein
MIMVVMMMRMMMMMMISPFPLFLFFLLFTGVDPLRVYIHDEGLTRISTSKYSLKNLDNKFAHLTNYSINKNADVVKCIPTLSSLPLSSSSSL